MNKLAQKTLVFGVIILGLMNVVLLIRPMIISAQSSTPGIISYQGRLTDLNDVPINEPIDMRFALYDGPGISATEVYSVPTQTVTVTNGVFAVEIGTDAAPIPLNIFEDNKTLYLGIRVDQDATDMLPRPRVTNVGFAYVAESATMATYAENADLLDDKDSTDFALITHTHPHTHAPTVMNLNTIETLLDRDENITADIENFKPLTITNSSFPTKTAVAVYLDILAVATTGSCCEQVVLIVREKDNPASEKEFFIEATEDFDLTQTFVWFPVNTNTGPDYTGSNVLLQWRVRSVDNPGTYVDVVTIKLSGYIDGGGPLVLGQ